MSFNLAEIGRCCVQQPPATLFFKPLSLRWHSTRQEGTEDTGCSQRFADGQQGRSALTYGGFFELSSLLASNLSLP